MKKLTALLAALVFAFAIAACSDDGDANGDTEVASPAATTAS